MDLITATAIERFGGQREPKTVKEVLDAIEGGASITAVSCLGAIGAHSYAMPITVQEKDVRGHAISQGPIAAPLCHQTKSPMSSWVLPRWLC